MKNKLLIFATLMLLLPLTVFAKEYNKFDIRFEEKIGTNVKNNEIKVYASVDDDEKLTDHTEDFTMEDVKWYKYTSTKEEGKTEEDYDYYDEEKNVYGYLVSDDDVFEEEYKYFLVISRLYAEEEDSFSRNVTINGVDIDEMDGVCYNTGNEFFIKTKAKGNSGPSTEEEEPVTTNNEPEEVETTTATEGKTCMLGISLCCMTFLGLSICMWILIAILLLLLLIIICAMKFKKRKDT